MFAGSSFTESATGYRAIATQWELVNKPSYLFTFSNQSIGGHNTWSNLVRLTTGTDLFVIDHANDTGGFVYASMEALIRRLWTANPNTRIIMISSPTWFGVDTDVDDNVNHPHNETELGVMAALAAQYGIPFVDYWAWCKSAVPGTYHLNQLTDDGVHPSAIGYAAMAVLLEAHLPNGGGAKPGTLPARLYASEDYENAPTRTNGSAETSRTGTWTEAGTSISSNEVGATITYGATCQSYGIYRADSVAVQAVEVSIDGGAYAAANISQNGLTIAGDRAAHTVTIKVLAGTVRIDEFWAV